MIKKISLILLLYILLGHSFILSSATQNGCRDKRIVILFDKSYENQSREILSRELNDFLVDTNYKISRIYMNCSAKCSENQMSRRFDKALLKAENRNPDFLIIGDEILWELYHDKIERFRQKLHVKVGLFNIFKDSEFFEGSFSEKYHGYFVDYNTFNLNTFMYYTKRNGVEFTNFYIIRDDSPYSLKVSMYVKCLLLSNGRLNIHVYNVSTIQGLKNTIIKLQSEPQGVIIPIIKQVLDSDAKKEIMNTIILHNRKHFELSVLEDDTKYLCFSLSHIVRSEFNTFKKYPEYPWADYDQINMSKLLNAFDGEHNIFTQEETYFIMNEQRVEEIFCGYKLLRFKNDYVDFLR